MFDIEDDPLQIMNYYQLTAGLESDEDDPNWLNVSESRGANFSSLPSQLPCENKNREGPKDSKENNPRHNLEHVVQGCLAEVIHQVVRNTN